MEKSWIFGLIARLFSGPAHPDPGSGAFNEPNRDLCRPETVVPGYVWPASGRPEDTLAGITVSRTTLSDLRRRARGSLQQKDYLATSGVASITWAESGSRIRVSVADQVARVVSVTGQSNPRVRTGRGLALGQSPVDLGRIYGQYSVTRDYYYLRWSDGTELRVRVHGANDRITVLELVTTIH